jgi:hypothetical protein
MTGTMAMHGHPATSCTRCTYRPPPMTRTMGMHGHPYELHNVYLQTATHDTYNAYACASIHELHNVYIDTAAHDRYNGYACASIHDLYKVCMKTSTLATYVYAWSSIYDFCNGLIHRNLRLFKRYTCCNPVRGGFIMFFAMCLYASP